MPLWLAIIGAILVLALLIFLHELGHFLAAKRNGVEVEEFAIGFGPLAWQRKFGETLWSLRIIPLGGYVKLYGENGVSKKMLTDKKSFAAKTPWQRIEILIAGVAMNFLVALILLMVGIALGMNPLFGDFQELNERLASGELRHEPGLVVKSVDLESWYAMPGYRLVEVDGKELIDVPNLAEIIRKPVAEDHRLTFVGLSDLRETRLLSAGTSLSDLEISFYDAAVLARPQVVAGPKLPELQVGDVLLSVNGRELTDLAALADVSWGRWNSYRVWRDDQIVELTIERELAGGAYITGVVTDSPAEQVGLQHLDHLLMIDGEIVPDAEGASAMLKATEPPVSLELERDGERLSLIIEAKKDGLIGVSLDDGVSQLMIADEFVMVPVVGSLVTIGHQVTPWYSVPIVAFQESYRLAKVTLRGLGSAVGGIVFHGNVPDEVGGPIAVTQMITDFFRYDAEALIWLIAVISLSLAVINIMPIPALDGGRLLFVLVEVLRGGKRVKPGLEAVVHLAGFLLLILLIIVVSFNDVVRLVK